MCLLDDALPGANTGAAPGVVCFFSKCFGVNGTSIGGSTNPAIPHGLRPPRPSPFPEGEGMNNSLRLPGEGAGRDGVAYGHEGGHHYIRSCR